jgi:predicted nucleic acid-binding Zn ribbon protein
MAAGEADKVTDRNRFRKTLVRVLMVQVVALVLLWALQAHYNVM